MLVIKKRSKLVKSLMAGVVMFGIGLTGSVAYLDATTPSGFVSGKDTTPLAKTDSAADESVESQAATGEPPTDATSSSSDQPDAAATFEPAPAASPKPIASQASGAATVEQTTPVLESAPIETAPEEPPVKEPSLLDSVISILLP